MTLSNVVPAVKLLLVDAGVAPANTEFIAGHRSEIIRPVGGRQPIVVRAAAAVPGSRVADHVGLLGGDARARVEGVARQVLDVLAAGEVQIDRAFTGDAGTVTV